MLNRIIEFSVKNKLIIGLFILALIGYGSYQTTKLPIDAVPDITNNQVQVITVAPSFGATDIERLVTFPIEQANNNIAGLKEIRSFSRFGLSLVTIVFDDETDIYWARQQIAERLQQVQMQIPKGIGIPTLAPITTGLGEIYQYVIKPKKGFENKYDATALRTIQDWIVRRQLLGVKGVAEVSSFGGKLKQYEIAINAGKLNAFGISINDVFNAIENNNQNTGGAYIEKAETVLYIRSEGLIGNVEDIENIAIDTKAKNTPLFIRDVAEVKIGFATRYGAMCYNDEGEVSGAIVMMLKGANSSDVIKDVKVRIEQIKKTLPEGVEIEPFLDRTKMVNNAISTVETNLLEGALIVIFVLVLFLGNLRAGLLVASVIPLSMLFAICMMNAFGVSGNLMSLGALDFGLIVDGAVIIVEAVMHQLVINKKNNQSLGLNSTQMNATVTSTASKMMNSAVFGQIIILIVYLPIFSLQGIEGKMFKPMAQTVAFALLGAFLLSLTYIPMMSALVLSKKVTIKKNLSDKLLHFLENVYQQCLKKVLRFSAVVFGIVLFLSVSAIVIMYNLGGEFIPVLEEGDFAVETRVLTGSNLNTTIKSTQQAAGILKKQFPEVLKVVTKIGSGEVPTDPMPMEASDMMIILKDKKEWTSATSFTELSAKMSKALEDVPGITAGFQYPVQMRFNELMTGARQDVVCKIFGENLDTLANNANKLAKIISTVQGVENLFVEPITGLPQIIITYNRALIAQYHLSISDVNKVINTAFAGQSAGLVFEDEKRFDVVVKLANTERQSVEDVQNLLIATPNGNQIPLSQLAKVEIKNGPNQIQREDAKRRIVVGFNVNGRDVQTIVNELQVKVNKSLTLPTGYFITYGGAFENLNQAKKRLMIAVPLSLILIFVLLFFAFKSVKQSLLIYTAIPLSAIGGIYFLAIRGMPFSISAGVGFIALFGVAVLNGIVLITEFNRLKNNGMQNVALIVLRGSKLRLRPVLITAFVASLGFLPMAISNGSGAEVQRPLATVVIGGLLVATFLTLFVLPLLYIFFEKGVKIKRPIKLKAVAILMLVGISISNFAQQKISLVQAVKMALANNKQIKNEQLKLDYAKILLKTATEIPKTNVILEYGQINSAFNDSKIGVVQNFAFPEVYKKQKQLLLAGYKDAGLNIELKEQELKKAVTEAFYNIIYLAQKQNLLLQADSLYKAFFEKVKLKLLKGETNILEKITAETHVVKIQTQLQQLQSDKQIAMVELQFLLNTQQVLNPMVASFKMPLQLSVDSNSISTNPILKKILQQKEMAKLQTAVEQSKLLPDLSLGYFNNSFVGTGADNVVYNSRSRFSAVQIGVGIPIFIGAQKGKIAASKLQENLIQHQYDIEKSILENKYSKLISMYQSNIAIVQLLENTSLKNANLILQTANKQFANGEINYLEFVMLCDQSIDIQNSYIDAVKALNDCIVLINFITSN